MMDPIELSKETKEKVCRDKQGKKERKYYRFRDTKFYGGIATGDCVGCNLRCLFCWAWNKTNNPENSGTFKEPGEVSGKLIKIAEENNYDKVRISGNEPTIGKEHLLRVLTELQETKLDFILETNGLLLGEDIGYVEELSDFKNFLRARVSIKGCSPEQFSKLTQADSRGFKLQLNSLKNLLDYEIDCHPAVMISFSTSKEVNRLREKLAGINPYFVNFEPEKVKDYGGAMVRLNKAGIETKEDQ